MHRLILNNMQVVLWSLSLDWYLVAGIFLHALVETLNLVFVKVVVKPYGWSEADKCQN